MNIMMLPPPTGLTGRLSVLHKFRVVAPARQRRTFAAQAPAAEAQVGEAAKVAGKYFWGFFESKAQVAIAAGLGLVVANFAATYGYELVYKRAVMDKFVHGLRPPQAPPVVLRREAVRREIRGLFRPEQPVRFFSVVAGPPGSGKSTLMRSVCREVSGGAGYIEVSPASEEGSFGRDLGASFNFRFEKHVSLLNIVSQSVLGTKTVEVSGEKLGPFRRSAEALHEAAREYRKQYGQPFVLVIDSVERLQQQDSQVLKALLAYAKDWALDETISIIFVTSDWPTLRVLLGDHPVASRASVPLWVGDVSEEEAAQYLQALGVEAKVVQQVVDLVGGSLLLLERAAGLHFGGCDFEAIKGRLLQLMALEFEEAGLLRDRKEEVPGLETLAALLASSDGKLSAVEWRQMLPDAQQQDKLLDGILHFDGEDVMFASRLAKVFAAEVLQARKAHATSH